MTGRGKKSRKASQDMSMLQAARLCAQIADEKKATDILLLNVREIFRIADYFVICTCESKPQVRAIAEEIEKRLKQEGYSHLGTEGRTEAAWILLDYGGVVAHVFLSETRDYYQIETLWGDAPELDWTEDKQQAAETK
jgi:ribosome-associated protein